MQSPNVISERIRDALDRYPPFSMMRPESVLMLALEARVCVRMAGEVLWHQKDPPPDGLYFMARGRVEYHWDNDGVHELVDVRDVGDLLGLTAILENTKTHLVTATVVEDALLYLLPATRMKELLEENEEAGHYARRHLFWATRVGVRIPSGMEIGKQPHHSILQAHLDGAQRVQVRPVERLLTCHKEDSIRKAAAMMVSKRVPSILVVDEQMCPLGVVTSVNLVKWVIVNGGDMDAPVSNVMASPVFTISPDSSATSAMLLMLRQRVGQVCVTQDGSSHSRALDVCTHKDLLAQSGNHPAGLLREIRFARSTVRLHGLCDEVEQIALSYIEAGVSGVLLGQICAELYDELVERLIEMAKDALSADGIHLPGVPWSWMAVGSDGRREQVLRTDMDNAFIFASSGDPDLDEQHRQIFLKLNAHVVGLLVECGFARCQGGVMASNPRWCRSETEWAGEIKTLLPNDPDALLRALVLYDLRFVAGNKDLCARVRKVVFDSVSGNSLLMRRMAEQVVEVPPPLNFWGQFVVERKGSQTGKFDIKSRGLAPLRDAARVLALRYGLTQRYSTGGRFEQLKVAAPHLAELADLAHEAYDFLLHLRIETGLRRKDTGRFIEPSALSKLERAQLSNVFDVVRMAQRTLQTEFHLEMR